MAKEAVFTGNAQKLAIELFFISSAMHAEKFKGMIHPALAMKVHNMAVTFLKFPDNITKDTVQDFQTTGEAIAAAKCAKAYAVKTNDSEREDFPELTAFLAAHFPNINA